MEGRRQLGVRCLIEALCCGRPQRLPGANERIQMSKSHLPRRACVVRAPGRLGDAVDRRPLPRVRRATLPTLNLSLTKSAMTASGSTVSGAVNIVTTSAKGLKEPTPVLFRLNPGETVAELEAIVKSKAITDPNNVSKARLDRVRREGNPGGTTEAQTELQPGNYVAAQRRR